MKDLKLTEILLSFSPEEMKRFKKFVDSPYHNGSENVTNFFKEVVKFYPDFSSRNYNLNYIYIKLFPQKKYHDGVIRNLVSDLYKLAGSFLVIDGIMNNEREFDLALLKRFKEREMDDLYYFNYKKTRKNLDKMKMDDAYYYDSYEIENDLWSLFIVDKKTGRKHENFVRSTVENTKLLSKFFLARILKSYCSIVSNSVDFEVKPELIFYDEIKNHIEKHKYEDSPLISLYFDSLELSIGEERDTIFKKLLSGIRKNKESLHHDDLHVLYINLLNHTILRKDYKSCFEIIKEVYSGQYYSRKGNQMFMEYGFYSAAVHTGIFLKEYEWIENFLKISKEHINPPHRENAYSYHLALFQFVNKNFEKAFETMSRLNPTDFFELSYTQRLRLMIYYELGKKEELLYLLDAHNHTLSRYSQIEERHKKSARDFVINFRDLLKLSEKFDSYDLSRLKEKVSIINGPNIYKNWFMDKLSDEIKKKGPGF